jgi:hypothetical protein
LTGKLINVAEQALSGTVAVVTGAGRGIGAGEAVFPDVSPDLSAR